MSRLPPILTVLLAAAEAFGLTPADRVVPLWVSLQTNPPALTLNWTSGGQPLSYLIQRKALLTTGWTESVTLTNPAAVTYTDSNVVTGVGYEYKVTRQDAVTNAWGYLYAGLDLPPVHDRGTLILVVESNAAIALSSELRRLELDLAGDGWKTEPLTAPWKNWNDSGWAEAVTNLKSQIVSLYSNNPTGVKGVLLFGHVPVPYSGDCCPDGHTNGHFGAWPADAYYGDMTNSWSDTNTSKYNQGPRLNNIPGDGKFDPTEFHEYSLQLMVGRVDLSDMPSFAQPEMELLRQYLAKDHHYRLGLIATQARGLVRDDFGFFYGEAFAQCGIRDFGTFYGPANVSNGAWFPELRNNRYQSAYGCGDGWFHGASGVGSTTDFATGPVHAVFTMLLGSYFGDWDNSDNFLRAPLASTPSALTCVWAGRPKWFTHPMDLGEPIGTAFRLLHGQIYLDYEQEVTASGVHTALMGDPTLRLRYPAPPQNLTATATVSQAVLSWTPPADAGAQGYVVSRAEAGSLSFSNLHDGFLTGTVFTDATVRTTGVLYRVRSMKKESVRSGAFTNLSQGVFLRVSAANAVNRPPVVTNVGIATIENRPVSLSLGAADPDGDPVFVSLAEWPSTGTLTGAPAQLVYSPASGYTGTVRFAYDASDGTADSPTGVVEITVCPPLTSRGTSCDWLIRTLGYTNDYEQADGEDPDGDGLPTWAEYQAGTDPLDPASLFAIRSIQPEGSSNRLTWYGTTNSGVTNPFAVKRSTNLETAAWPWIASNLVRHSSGTNTWWDTNLPERAFYRVIIP